MNEPLLLNRFDQTAALVLQRAQAEATARNLPAIDSVSLLLALLGEPSITAAGVLAGHRIDREAILAAVPGCLGDRPLILADQPVTAVRDAIAKAINGADTRGDALASADELAIALLEGGKGLAIEVLRALGHDPTELAQ